MSANPSCFVSKIEPHLHAKLQADLKEQGFTFVFPPPPYTVFSAKKTGLSCSLYTSGKFVVQGANLKEFVEFYLEPEILHTFAFTNPEAHLNLTPRIGIDESGKGDLFGPLCAAGVYANAEQIKALSKIGVCDSKSLNDQAIDRMAPQILKLCPHHIVKISPQRYNDLYANFKNLNHLLAWAHSAAIEALVQQTDCRDVIIDQFAAEHVVETALRKKNLAVHLTQRHRAEEDVVVAAASILARYSFLQGLKALSEEYGIDLPKGASTLTVKAAEKFAKTHGKNVLVKVSKLHFKSLDGILGRTDTDLFSGPGRT